MDAFKGCRLLWKTKGIKRAQKYIQTEEFSSFSLIGLYYKYFFQLHYCGYYHALSLAVFSVWEILWSQLSDLSILIIDPMA